jgi:hyaluronoglucosaminidase
VRSARELEVIDGRALGLAYQKLATASSSHAKEYLPANAVDGDPGTYWSSTFADPAWLAVDLGESHKISQVRITWENAYSKEFAVQVSRDGQNWTDVFTEANGKGGVSDLRFPSVEARHVRISCTKRGTQWGHAIRELEVFE